MGRFKFIVLSKSRPGREAEFADWYANTHIDDVLATPGVLSAQLFECVHVRRDAAGNGFTHMAEYEFEADDPAELAAALNAQHAAGRMRMIDAMDPGNISCFFKPASARKTK